MTIYPNVSTSNFKKITGKDIYEAIEKNGFKVIRESWITLDEEGKIAGACLLGQAAINLGVKANAGGVSLFDALNSVVLPENHPWYDASFDAFGEDIQVSNSLGDVIIRNFDAYNDNWEDEDSPYKFSWEESLAMAKSVLTPYWEHKFTVQTYEWSV